MVRGVFSRHPWGGGLVFVLAHAGMASGQYDYNADCVSGFSDQIAFLKDFNSANLTADLNLDGVVNQADYDLFVANKVRPNFHFYWMVTNEGHNWNPYMDIDLPVEQYSIDRNCRILYEGWFPIMPFDRDANNKPFNAGFHRIFQGLGGSYTTWELNYDTWLATFDATIAAVMTAAVPLGFSGETSLDIETVIPNYHLLQIFYVNDQITAWNAMVKTINSPNLNTEFMRRFGYSAPTNARKWTDLSTDQQATFYSTTYNTVALDFFVRMVNGCRTYRPNATYSFYNLPKAMWEIYTDDRRQCNDEMADLWAAVDTLAPSTYQQHYTTNNPASCPCPNDANTPGQNSAFFSSSLDEMQRVKNAYGRANQRVMVYTTWGFAPGAGACSSNLQKLLIPDIDVKQVLNLSRSFGADAVAIWGDLNSATGPEGWRWTSAEVQADIEARWAPITRQLACPK